MQDQVMFMYYRYDGTKDNQLVKGLLLPEMFHNFTAMAH